jgi:hypothetical protein
MDYAICRLIKPLGNTVGFMGYQYYGDDDDYYNGWWASVGYPREPPTNPNGNFMVVEDNVRIVDVDDDGEDGDGHEGRELETNVYGFFG